MTQATAHLWSIQTHFLTVHRSLLHMIDRIDHDGCLGVVQRWLDEAPRDVKLPDGYSDLVRFAIVLTHGMVEESMRRLLWARRKLDDHTQASLWVLINDGNQLERRVAQLKIEPSVIHPFRAAFDDVCRRRRRIVHHWDSPADRFRRADMGREEVATVKQWSGKMHTMCTDVAKTCQSVWLESAETAVPKPPMEWLNE